MATYLLDVTRTFSRVGIGPATGIDRVERAYVREIARRDPGALALARFGRDHVVAPLAPVAEALEALARGALPGRPHLRDLLRLRTPRPQRVARRIMREAAIATSRAPRSALAAVPFRQYLNVGHANLSEDMLSAVAASDAESIVFVHDLIPIDFPEYTPARTVRDFAAAMAAVARHATRLATNSQATAARLEAFLAEHGRQAPVVVAPLGVAPPLLPRAPSAEPVFVTLGTIEPRKNHALLLDAWEILAGKGLQPLPKLEIIGRRGWMNDSLFARLDARPAGVTELGPLDDHRTAERLSAACAMLFPSFAEGFGLPALEAAQIGLPVICSDIPVFREFLDGYATFLDPRDPAAWAREIARLSRGGPPAVAPEPRRPPIPQWDTHFRHVLG